jgi:dUTP pyrophosphatase
MKVKIKKLQEDAKLPSYAHPGDVGLDLYSREDTVIEPGKHYLFDIGVAIEFETGYAAIVKDKGGVSKSGVHSMGGVFDAGYRGTYIIHLVNLGHEPYEVKKGQKIAQLIIFPVAIADIQEVDELSDSARGEGRFGSTGKF